MKRRVKNLIWILLVAYCVCYASKFLRVNREHGYDHVRASEIPEECLSFVGLSNEPPENVDVIVIRQDIDGDGECELLVDAGEYARGAANCEYGIWKRRPSGKLDMIGILFADRFWLIPPLTIFGHSSILCIESNGEWSWLRWEGDSYSDGTKDGSP